MQGLEASLEPQINLVTYIPYLCTIPCRPSKFGYSLLSDTSAIRQSQVKDFSGNCSQIQTAAT